MLEKVLSFCNLGNLLSIRCAYHFIIQQLNEKAGAKVISRRDKVLFHRRKISLFP